MALKGALEDFEIADLLQLIQMGNKDGALSIEGKEGKGIIYIEKGIVKHAECPDGEGEIAITKIMQWKKGTFEFVIGEKTEKNTIGLPVAALILECARKIDEWKKIEKLVPSLNAIFEIEPNPDTDMEMIELTGSEWRVLSQIDGVKSVKALSEILKLGQFETAKILYGLALSGLIRRKEIKEEKKEEKDELGFKGLFRRFKKK